MTGADVISGQFLRLEHEPLAQLARISDDEWELLGWDAQFLIRLPEPPRVGGLYRFAMELSGPGVVKPCLYFDNGSGWSESGRLDFERIAGTSSWWAYALFENEPDSIRFDPGDRPGRVRFGGMTLEYSDRPKALLSLLSRRISESREGVAAGIVRESERIEALHGFDACCRWLLKGIEASSHPGQLAYDEWIRRFDTLSDAEALRLADAVNRLPSRPQITVLVAVLPTRNPSEAAKSLESVIAQIYPDWTLGIICSSDVSAQWQSYAALSSRITILENPFPEKADALCMGMDWAAGGHVIWLDAGDVLAAHALAMTADAIINNPGVGVVYSDSDRIDARGRRTQPDFKPDWNPTLLRGQHYISPFVVYDVNVARSAARDIDAPSSRALALSCLAKLASDSIVHVPFVLCHSPHEPITIGNDTAPAELTSPPPKVSLIIPTRDNVGLLRQCIDSILLLTRYPDFEVLIVDNQSQEQETKDYFATLSDPRVRVLPFDAEFNYSAINNYAVSEAEGAVIGLVNNDVEVINHDWLEIMARYAMEPANGAVGAMLYYPDDTIQHAGIVLGLGGVAGHAYSRNPRGTTGYMGRARLAQNVSAVTGACLVLRKEVYEDVGGLDERLRVAFNDVDLCLKLLERGYRNVWVPQAELYHHESASRGAEDTPEKQQRFQSEIAFMVERWGALLHRDPAYNSNLSLEHDQFFELAAHPRQPLASWVDAFSNTRG